MKKSLPPYVATGADAYLAAIVASSDDAIISKDLNGNVTSWNPSAERIFGYMADEIIGRHISIIIPADRMDEEDKIINTLNAGNRIDHFETWRRHKDGHLVPVSITVSPIRDAKGKVIGASKVSRDISERIRAEEALKQLNLKKDEFLANMSHELRTPMNAVIGLATLLMRMDNLPPQAYKFIETLKISADNLMELINDLLDFAKIESGSMELEKIDFNLAEQIQKAISVVNVKAQEKQLKLNVHYPATLNRHYVGDPLRVHQVLMNLLSNAVKFTDNGSVDVHISNEPNSAEGVATIVIRVTDTGIGIAPDKLKAIFDKFTQADSSTTRRFGGSGLGLAITKAFVEKMGGTISVSSEQGVGSTFAIRIPLGISDRLVSIEHFTASPLPEAVAHSRNVLLVEDYEPNLMVASAMLEQMGYNFDIARNGFEALRKFVQGRYDVILMDVQMHELDGLEATRRIRRIERERDLDRTPIIAMTAHVREQDKEKCFEAGMDDFVPKPFEPTELSRKIHRYVHLNTDPSLQSPAKLA